MNNIVKTIETNFSDVKHLNFNRDDVVTVGEILCDNCKSVNKVKVWFEYGFTLPKSIECCSCEEDIVVKGKLVPSLVITIENPNFYSDEIKEIVEMI